MLINQPNKPSLESDSAQAVHFLAQKLHVELAKLNEESDFFTSKAQEKNILWTETNEFLDTFISQTDQVANLLSALNKVLEGHPERITLFKSYKGLINKAIEDIEKLQSKVLENNQLLVSTLNRQKEVRKAVQAFQKGTLKDDQ